MVGPRLGFLALVLTTLGLFGLGGRGEPEAARGLASGAGDTSVSAVKEELRLELLESLEKWVIHERHHRAVYGYYSASLSRVGFAAPARLKSIYDFRPLEASSDRFLASAVAQGGAGRGRDLVTIDQDFRVRANFPLPTPKAGLLKAHALRHLRALGDATGAAPEERGVFQGYFRYSKLSGVRKVWQAVGVRAPVLGLSLSLEASLAEKKQTEISGALVGSEEEHLKGEKENLTGEARLPSVLEELYLAQRIFHSETGRYARDWAELAEVAQFGVESAGADRADHRNGRKPSRVPAQGEPAASAQEENAFEPVEFEAVDDHRNAP